MRPLRDRIQPCQPKAFLKTLEQLRPQRSRNCFQSRSISRAAVRYDSMSIDNPQALSTSVLRQMHHCFRTHDTRSAAGSR